MAELTFEMDWEDPLGARGPELRATWARLEVRVGEEVVTRVFDARTRSVRDSIYLPLYPLAEWVATNWWRLLYEVRSSGDFEPHRCPARHCLRRGSEGFAFPDLTFEPMGAQVRLSWAGKRLEHSPLEFLGRETVYLSREAVEEGLRQLVDAVLGRLEDHEVAETLLQQEWRALQALDDEEQDFCRRAGALGLDPFRVGEDQAEQLVTAARRLPGALQEEFFASADPANYPQEAEAVARVLESVRGEHEGLEPLRELRERGTLPGTVGGPPWNQGYEMARALRAELGLDGRPLPSFAAIASALGVEEARLTPTISRARELGTVDGLVAFDDERRPGFALRATAEEARRFGFCRTFFEFLTGSGLAPSIITRGATDRQQRNRAFAAEFLAPSERLRARSPGEVVTPDEVDELARDFGVSWAVVSHQLQNHRIARVSTD